MAEVVWSVYDMVARKDVAIMFAESDAVGVARERNASSDVPRYQVERSLAFKSEGKVV